MTWSWLRLAASQPVAANCCEFAHSLAALHLFRFHHQVLRNASYWSTYDFIHNKKRNRLTEARARDLVYVHSNLRLLEHIEAVDYTEATVQWEAWAVENSEAEEDENEDEGLQFRL